MRILIFAIVVLLSVNVYAQAPKTVVPKTEAQNIEEVAKEVSKTQQPVSLKLKTPNSETVEAIAFLETLAPEDRNYIKLFTQYNLPADVTLKGEGGEISLRDAALLTFRFWIHSLSSAFNFVQPVKVSDTLYAIDIRDYGWTPEAFEKVSEIDPYFRVPWIDQAVDAQMRLIGGNAILRMDWFIVHSSNTTKQLDVGINIFPYYELLYARHGIPKNVDELRKVWGFDLAQSEDFRILKGTVVDNGKSIVATHNRQLTRARTSTGYWWETSDVKNVEEQKDYVENLDPTIRKEHVDAGEIIGSNYIGMQIYALVDGQGNRIEFADNAIATDGTDSRDKRVRTARSCIICHPRGINHADNAVVDILDTTILNVHDKVDRNILDGFYVNNNLTELINDDQELYARAIEQANGLTPELNMYYYEQLVSWYEKDIDQAQAVLEWGVSPEKMKEKLSVSISARLLGLTKNKPVSRPLWEKLKGGVFAQGMLYINNLQIPAEQVEEIVKEQEEIPVVSEPAPETPKVMATVLGQGARIMNGETEVGIIPAGTVIEILEERPSWSKVKYNDLNGWILTESVEKN